MSGLMWLCAIVFVLAAMYSLPVSAGVNRNKEEPFKLEIKSGNNKMMPTKQKRHMESEMVVKKLLLEHQEKDEARVAEALAKEQEKDEKLQRRAEANAEPNTWRRQKKCGVALEDNFKKTAMTWVS
uniref:DUF148 domain-containing protein n=1 Tax=Globodera pallida TaxID=36090 RepID=A0A183CFD5_GLOPA